jgi:ribosomal protein S18 acetylase RimI-like enzyme
LIRPATDADLEALAETLALAFADDPVWGWGFEGSEPGRLGADARESKLAALRRVFGFLAAAALPHGWVWLSGDGAAVSVWIPPGEAEMSVADEARFPAVVQEACGPRVAPRILGLMEAFERAHPHGPPHYYLSLLATHPGHAGKGLGMNLLAANLETIDDAGGTAYLESSNPANVGRYERLGFRPEREVPLSDGIAVTQMWRRSS